MNLSRIIEHWARTSPAGCAIHFQGADLSYAALWQRIDAATTTLATRFAVTSGERLAYLGLNHPDFVVFLMAVCRLGAIAVPLNFRLAAGELQAILQDSGARLLFTDQAMRALAESAVANLDVPLVASDELRSNSKSMHLEAHASDASECLIVYTSGTTGRPKGAVHTQANLLWNIQSAIAAQDLTSRDHLLSVLPMFHVGGLCIQLLPVLAAGGTVTLHARFEAGQWLADVGSRRPTLSLLVPATLKAVLDHPHWAKTDLTSLRFVNTGSSTIAHALIEAVHARGVPVSQVYGATETGPVSIALRPQEALAHVGSAGKPALHVEVRLMKPDGGLARSGEVGEIQVRGLNVVARYWHDIEAHTFVDGWFRSGDLAYCDAEGFYWVVGRSRDLIISGGENIYPAELENILATCESVLEFSVLGEPDEHWGETVVAALVLRDGVRANASEIMALFEGKLARYKHPRRIVFLEALPKTALGKVKKIELRALLRSHNA